MNIEEIKAIEQAATVKIDRSREELVKLDVLGESALKSAKLMDLIVNGATLMSVNKETLRGIIRVIITGAAAEVERLTAENEQNAAYADIYIDICDKYGRNFSALLDKAKALQTENATLKRALEKDSECVYKTSDGYCELHSDGVEFREPCIEGPCDDFKAQEQEGKK